MTPMEEGAKPDNLYEGGQGDGRQTTRAHLEASEVLFRPRYRKLNESEIDLHDRIKTQAAVLAALFYEVEPIHAGPSRNRERGANVQLAIRNLEDAVYRAVKGLTGPTMESEKTAVDERLAKAERLREELNKAKESRPELFGDGGRADLGKDVGDAERKTGIADLPADQQKQADEGRPVDPKPDPGSAAPETETPMRDQMLIGSDAFDSHIRIGIEDVQLGEIVARAQSKSGYSVEAWNNASQVLRDTLISATIASMREERKAAYTAGLETESAAARPVDDDGGRGSTGDAAIVTNGPQV